MARRGVSERRPAGHDGDFLERVLPELTWRNRRLPPSTVALLVANVVPILGAVVFGWDVYPLMMLYWAENVVVGVFTALRMLTARADAGEGCGAKLFMVAFFTVHYGGFAAGHWVFLYFIFGSRGGPGIASPAFALAVAAFAVSHGFSFVRNYLGGGEFRHARAGDLIMAPYRRVVVLHVVILVGAMPVMALGSPVAGLVVLAVVKTIVDWRAHEREHGGWHVDV